MDYKEKVIALIESRELSKEQKEKLEEVFPELKESEDEKIRKAIIEIVKKDEERIGVNAHLKKIQWLEKQGEQILANSAKTCKDEQKPFDKIQIGKKYKCIASPRYSMFITGKIYKPEDEFLCSLMNFCSDCFEPIEDGEQKQKHFELKAGHWYICHRAFCCRADHLTVKEGERFMCEKDGIVKGFEIKEPEKYFKEICAPAPIEDEQKPAWSEEDINMFGSILSTLGICANNPQIPAAVRSIHKKEESWFKELYHRVQPKQEWSEDDEKMIKNIIYDLDYLEKECCNDHYEGSRDRNPYHYSELINWLKSLRPQNHWIPSEEQIKVLQELCKYSEVANLTEKGVEILKSMYNDIKKLTE